MDRCHQMNNKNVPRERDRDTCGEKIEIIILLCHLKYGIV